VCCFYVKSQYDDYDFAECGQEKWENVIFYQSTVFTSKFNTSSVNRVAPVVTNPPPPLAMLVLSSVNWPCNLVLEFLLPCSCLLLVTEINRTLVLTWFLSLSPGMNPCHEGMLWLSVEITWKWYMWIEPLDQPKPFMLFQVHSRLSLPGTTWEPSRWGARFTYESKVYG